MGNIKAIDYTPFLVNALIMNKKARKKIDEIYKKNTEEFYLLAKESELYNYPIITNGDICKEKYGRKALGIVIAAGKKEEYLEDIVKVIKAGWPYIYSFVEESDIIDLGKYIKRFPYKKDKIEEFVNEDMILMIWLAELRGKDFANNEINNNLIRLTQKRVETYDKRSKEGCKTPYDAFDKEFKIEICNLRKEIFDECGKIHSYYDIYLKKEKEVEECYTFINKLFDSEGLDPFSLIKHIRFSRKNIDEILGFYLESVKKAKEAIDEEDEEVKSTRKNKEFEEEKVIKTFILGMVLRSMLRAYSDLKKHYYNYTDDEVLAEKKQQEKTILSLMAANESLQKEVKRLKKRLSKDIDKVESQYRREIKKLKDERDSLRVELEEEKQKNEELYALRELMFELDNEVEYRELEEDIEMDINGIIVGGHDKWQQKMKESLPTFKFISADNENFDPAIMDNVDIVFFHTNYLPHALYYKAVGLARTKGIKIACIRHINPENAINKIKQVVKEYKKNI